MAGPAPRTVCARALRLVWQGGNPGRPGAPIWDRARNAYMAARGAGTAGIKRGRPRRLLRLAQWASEQQDMAMSAKKPAADKRTTTVVADDPDDRKGTLKSIGGSQSDHWNNVLGNQALRSLWIKHLDNEARDRQYGAAIAGLIGIGPKDEIEGMIAAQLIAAHNAAMECYRRAMLANQTFEGKKESINQQAVPHLRNSTRGPESPPRQGPAEGHGRARARTCRRSGGGRDGPDQDPGGWGSAEIRESTPCKANCPCTAAGGVERGQGAGADVSPQPCRTAAAGCTADSRRAHRGVTRMPSSTDATRPRRLPTGARSRRWYAP